MTVETPDLADEDAIRTLIEYWVEAALAKDLDAVMGCYTPDVVAFDAISALRFSGARAYRTHWESCLSFAPEGETIMEVHDLSTQVSGDVAFSHYLSRCGCSDETGEMKAGWMRATVCCRKVDGKWLIAHEHYSAPFDPQSGKALYDLEP